MKRPISMLDTPDGIRIAFQRTLGTVPNILFCGGFRSDMSGTKALALDEMASRKGYGFTRFDYRGHGESDGAFRDGTIGLWRNDALLVLDKATEGPVVIVGSSMGAWIAMLLGLARPDRVAGLMLIAPAIDFTEALIWERLPEDAREALQRDGVWLRQSDYADEPDEITLGLIEEGRKHLLLGRPIPFRGPVRMLHGTADETVPWRHALRIMDALTAADVTLALIKDGGHRLSDPVNLQRILSTTEELVSLAAQSRPGNPSR